MMAMLSEFKRTYMVLDEHTMSSGIGLFFAPFLFAVGLVLISYLDGLHIYFLKLFSSIKEMNE